MTTNIKNWFKFNNTAFKIYHIIASASVLLLILYGTWSQWLTCVVAYSIYMLVSTVMQHRYLSHKSFECPTWFLWVGTIVSVLGVSGPTISWVAIHRAHHRTVETEQDPHSPWFRSLRSIFYPKLFLYSPPTILRYIMDLRSMPFHVNIFQYYWAINLVFVTLIITLFGWFAVVYIYLVPTLMKTYASSLFNIVCHKWGYRLYDTPDKSTNNFWMFFLTFGEAWHNTHHAFPTDSKSSRKWWELDPQYWLIRAVQFVSGIPHSRRGHEDHNKL
jgi:fatty-acid desaturase